MPDTLSTGDSSWDANRIWLTRSISDLIAGQARVIDELQALNTRMSLIELRVMMWNSVLSLVITSAITFLFHILEARGHP